MGEAETKSLGHHQQRRPPLQRSYSVKHKKESSWQSLKAATFRVANAVVLPKNQRALLTSPASRSSSVRTKSRSIALQPIKSRATPSEPQTPEADAFLNAPSFTGRALRTRALLPSEPPTPEGDTFLNAPSFSEPALRTRALFPSEPPTPEGDAFLHAPSFIGPTSRTRALLPSQPPTPEGDAFLQAPSFRRPVIRARVLLPPPPPPPLSFPHHYDETKSAEIKIFNDNDEDKLEIKGLELHDGRAAGDGIRMQDDKRGFDADRLQRKFRVVATTEDGTLMTKDMPLSVSGQDLNADTDEDELCYYQEDEDDEDLVYHNFYNCMPPPIFMFCITMAELGFFIYHTRMIVNDPKHGYVGKYGPAPLDSILIYDPRRRYEVWRYFTYAMVHSGYMHIINNVVIQLVLGVLLEMVHKWWRILIIYIAGVLAGSLATSIAQPFNYLAGASAGVYALIAAHLSTVILNWNEMEYPWLRVLLFIAFLVHDAGTAFYITFITGETTNVGYACHLGGGVAGLLVGIHVLKNLQWEKWEEVLWYTSVVMCAVLFVFAVLWNVIRTDLFP